MKPEIEELRRLILDLQYAYSRLRERAESYERELLRLRNVVCEEDVESIDRALGDSGETKNQ